MQGYNTLWLPGMDHAGIATQNVVERELAKEGLSRHDLGREAFVERVWQWKAESGGKILGQMRRLGDSVDWSRERFTMDEGLSRAVQTIFKRLFDDGLIYRAERIINWCPRCLTALSDIEVDHSDDDGELVSIRYGSVGKDQVNDSIVVATTRAETMLGDTAVAVHPDDARYTRLVGKTVELPLTGRRIPIVADEHVDPAFGTGAVKVTPAHDPNDFEIGRRHDLPSITVLDEHGVITAHGPFQGLDRFEARPGRGPRAARAGPDRGREAPVRALGRALQPLRHHGRAAPVAAVVRPRRPAGQGRGRRGPRRPCPAAPAGDERQVLRLGGRHARLVHLPPAVVGPPYSGFLRAERAGGLRRPRRAAARGVDAGPRRARHLVLLGAVAVLHPGLARRHARPAHLLPEQRAGHRLRHPVLLGRPDDDVRPVRDAGGGRPPTPCRSASWSLHGLVRDQFGKKMSKSRGNTVDPLDWVDRFGADATRFTLARGANPGGDIAISEEWAAGSRNFCNKLWNAVRFALLNGARVADAPSFSGPDPAAFSVPDRWILSRLSAVIAEIDQLFEAFEFGKICDVLYHFAWDEVLRLVPGAGQGAAGLRRPRRRGDDPAGARLRAGPAAAAAAPGHAVRHRGAVDRADRRGLGHGGRLAGVRVRRPRGRGGDHLDDAAGDRDPPVPLGSGAAARPAGGGPAGRHRGHAAGRARGTDPVAAAA